MLESIGKAIELAQRIAGLASTVKNIELKESIVELRSQLLDAKIEIANLIEEIDALQRERAVKESIPPMKIGQYGLSFTEDGEGPFCTNCLDIRKIKVRPNPAPGALKAVYQFKCNECKAIYNRATFACSDTNLAWSGLNRIESANVVPSAS